MLNLLNELESARRACRLYPKGHPALAAVRERALARMHEPEYGGRWGLGVTGDGFVLDGKLIDATAKAPSERLRRHLLELGVTGLRFELPEAAGSLFALVATLAELGDPPEDADRERFLSLRETFTGVDVIAVDANAIIILDETAPAAGDGEAMTWQQVVTQLLGSGPLPHVAAEVDALCDPRGLADAIDDDRSATEVLDNVLARLADLLDRDGSTTASIPREAGRAFLSELLGLLSPDRRRLAVAVAARHLRLDTREAPGAPPLVEVGTVLDAVDRTVELGEDVPAPLSELLNRLVNDPDLADVVGSENRARAIALLAHVEEATSETGVAAAGGENDLDAEWRTRPWARQLFASLQPEAVRRHLIQVCGEVVSLWPAEQIADKATERLVDEIVYALEVGDVEGAGRIAPMLAASANPTARRALSASIVRAARKAYRTLDPQYHGGVGAVLHVLGDTALPSILGALAEESSLVVRKRFLEVVLRQGRTAIPHVRALLADRRWYVVRNGIFLLRKLGDQRLPEQIMDRLPAAEPPLAAEILKALVAAEYPGWLAVVLRELDSPDERRARAALSVAVKIHHTDVARALADLVDARIGLRLREPFTRELIRVLGRLRDPVALPVLEKITLLKQWMYPFTLTSVRAEAAAAIAVLDDPAARRLCARLQRDREPAVAQAALGGRPGDA